MGFSTRLNGVAIFTSHGAWQITGIPTPFASREQQLKGNLSENQRRNQTIRFFWLPSSPENQIYGTLTISDGGNIKLELTQSLDPSIKAQLGGTHPDSLNHLANNN